MSALPDFGHHEESESLQRRFAKDVTSLLEVMRACGNPFLKESGPDLITLDTREVMNEESQDALSMHLRKEKNCMKATSEAVLSTTLLLSLTLSRGTLSPPVRSQLAQRPGAAKCLW